MKSPFVKATKTRAKARIAIDGPSGSGKTYTALGAASVLAQGGKIAVIDTERESASLYSDKFDFDVAPLDNFHPENYIKLIEAAEAAGYAVIVIDSLSHAWEGEGGILDLHDAATSRQKTPNGYTAWKDVTPIHRKLVDKMLQARCHIIVTMRTKMEYSQEKDEKGRTVIRRVGLAPIQRAGMEYEFTVVADMDVEHTLVVTKSRCESISDAVVKRPGPEFWQKFADWLNDGALPAPKPPTKDELIKVALALLNKGLAIKTDNQIQVQPENLQILLKDPSLTGLKACSREQLSKLMSLLQEHSEDELKAKIMEAMN